MGSHNRPKAYYETASPYFDVSNKTEEEKDGFVRAIGASSKTDIMLVLLVILVITAIYAAANNGGLIR